MNEQYKEILEEAGFETYPFGYKNKFCRVIVMYSGITFIDENGKEHFYTHSMENLLYGLFKHGRVRL